MRRAIAFGLPVVVVLLTTFWLWNGGRSRPRVEPLSPAPQVPIALLDSPAETQVATSPSIQPDRPAPRAIDALLWGRVSLADGTPVEGVTVRAWPDVPAYKVDDLLPPLDEAVRRRERRDAWRTQFAHSATTNASGEFEISSLVAAVYAVEAEFRGQCSRRLEADDAVSPGAYVALTILASAPRLVEVRVIEEGAAAPFALVSVEPGADPFYRQYLSALPRSTTRESPDGQSFDFSWRPAKDPRLSIPLVTGARLYAKGFGQLRASPSIVWDGATEPIELVLPVMNRIEVTVEYPEGSDEDVEWIGFLPIDPQRPPSLETFARGAEWKEVWSQPVYQIALGAPAGQYLVGVKLTREKRNRRGSRGRGPLPPSTPGEVDATSTVEVTSGCARVHIEVPARVLADGIVVSCVGFENTPRLGLRYEVFKQGGKDGVRRESASARVSNLPDGRVLLHGYGKDIESRLDGNEPGRVWVEADGQFRALVPVGPIEEKVVVIRRPAPSRVEVSIVTSSGAPAERPAKLGIDLVNEHGDSPRVTWIGSVATFDPVYTGAYKLSVGISSTSQGGSFLLKAISVQVDEGATINESYELETLCPLEFLGCPPGGTFATFKDENSREGFLSKRYAPFNLLLPAGRYRVFFYDKEVPAFEFSIPETTTLDLRELVVEKPK